MLCAICKINEATQEHHLSYDPEIKINVCISCHQLLHGHGVGRGASSIKEKSAMTFEEKLDARDKVSIKIQDAFLNLVYVCNNCGDKEYILQDFISYMINPRKLHYPASKCRCCNRKCYFLEVSECSIVGKKFFESEIKRGEV